MGLRQRIELVTASRDLLNSLAVKYHYMHKAIHPRACPFGWSVRFDGEEHAGDGEWMGFIIFSSIHFTKLKGEFGGDGLPTRWQVLQLSRLWLHDSLPRNSETVVIAKALKMVQRRWIEVHPPRFPDEPYHILKIISYCDTEFYRGTIYRAANFREYGVVSSNRGKTNRGYKSGSEKICFIYDLEAPRWVYESPQLSLFPNGEMYE